MARSNGTRSVIASALVALAATAGLALPAQAAAPDLGQQNRVVELVNQARAQAGCRPLEVDDRLVAAANGHSSDMAARHYFAHTTPEGVTFDERIEQAGYPQPGAENIAQGQQDADAVMRSWMDSEGHRDNILNCDLAKIGVGVETGSRTWTQDFGY